MKKVGRPKNVKVGKEYRGTVKQVRWTASEWELVVSGARDAGVTESAYIRGKVLGGEK